MATRTPTEAPTQRGRLARGGEPLYQQLVASLRNGIVKGEYAVGSQLPTEGELCSRYRVSRHTVREALRHLRDDGLVTSQRGSGSRVASQGTTAGYVHQVDSINDLIQYATAVRYQVERNELITADAQLAPRLRCPPGQKWLRLEGYRYSEDSDFPVCWTLVYVHADFAGVARLVGRRPGAIYELIEDLYGERVAEVEQILHARSVPAAIAGPLQVPPEATVIEVVRTYTLTSGKVSEVAINLYPSDRFSFAIKLRRRKE